MSSSTDGGNCMRRHLQPPRLFQSGVKTPHCWVHLMFRTFGFESKRKLKPTVSVATRTMFETSQVPSAHELDRRVRLANPNEEPPALANPRSIRFVRKSVQGLLYPKPGL